MIMVSWEDTKAALRSFLGSYIADILRRKILPSFTFDINLRLKLKLFRHTVSNVYLFLIENLI